MSGCVHVAVCVCKTQKDTERQSKRMTEQRHRGDIYLFKMQYILKNNSLQSNSMGLI